MSWLTPLDIGLTMGMIFAWAVLSLTISFRIFNFPDLTIEGSFPMGAAVFAMMMKHHASLTVAVPTAVAAGSLAGALTAVLHVKFALNKFLAGILVVAITYSVNLRVMGASNIGLLQTPSLFDAAGTLDRRLRGPFHVGTLLVLVVMLAVGCAILLFSLGTRRGTRLRAVGSNPHYARSLGINVPVALIFTLAATNGLAALSGVLLAMYQGFTDVGMGMGTLVLSLAAMAIGERLVPEKTLAFHVFVVVAAIVGSIVYQAIVAYAVRVGLAPTDLKLVTALIVLVVIVLRVSKDGAFLEERL